MADRAIMHQITSILSEEEAGSFTVFCEVTYIHDTDVPSKTISVLTSMNIGDSAIVMRDKLVAQIRTVALENGFDVSANNSILMLSLQKV